MSTKIQILSNTNYSLVNVLKSELTESTIVKIAVAFVRKTGIDELYKSLDYALTINNAKIEIIAGLDFKTTDATALLTLLEIEEKFSGFSFYCFGDRRDNYNDLVFHPKIYLLETSLSKNTKYTSVIGSSNLTRGGLNTNFEVNSIFREDKPIYYSQLEAIYNEVKYTDSVFKPNRNYILRYNNLNKEIRRAEDITSANIKDEINELTSEELKLPGTVPTLKRIIIDIIKKKISDGMKEVPLELIYEESEKIVNDKNYNFKMDTFRNSIRGELNRSEKDSTHPQNMFLFIRTSKGNYSLTDKGFNYEGR